jgi:hypothetical protein
MNINDQLKIAPQSYRQLSADDRQTILKATIQFLNDNNNDAFLKQVRPIRGVKFEMQRIKGMDNFREILNVSQLSDYECNGKKLFENLKPHEKDRLIQVGNTLNTGNSSKVDPNLQQQQQQQRDIAIKFAETMKPETFSDYMSYVEFAIAKQQNDMKNINVANKPNNMTDRNFKMSEYCNHFKDNDGNWNESAFKAMKQDFDMKRTIMKPLNETLSARFASSNAAVYHVEKHGDPGEIGSKAYIDRINYVIKNATENNVSWSQEGDAKFISYILHEPGSRVKTQVFVIYNSEKKTYTMSMFDKKT